MIVNFESCGMEGAFKKNKKNTQQIDPIRSKFRQDKKQIRISINLEYLQLNILSDQKVSSHIHSQ